LPRQSSSQEIPLGEQLLKSLIQSPEEATKYFLPGDALHAILNRESLHRYFRKSMSNEVVETICDYVYGTQRTTNIQGTAQKILATLLLTGKEDSILDFKVDEIYDKDLPLIREGEFGADFRLTRMSNKNGPPLTCFETWTPREIQDFDRYQWSLLSPFFSQDSHRKVLFYRLHDRVILPWTEDTQTNEGGYSTIRRVKIHAAHHNFNTTSVPHSKYQCTWETS
jgi:hypothetical protein